jgi:hypothetical protein
MRKNGKDVAADEPVSYFLRCCRGFETDEHGLVSSQILV